MAGPATAGTVGHLLPVVWVSPVALLLGENVGPRVPADMAVVLVGVGGVDQRRAAGGGLRAAKAVSSVPAAKVPRPRSPTQAYAP
ncbi:hypothetical protein [Streptomyces sp. NPDC058677]|uniref:hypothetical protein n=1 Tax=Streptomyces sp. NPDC058677 TaxID=3346594 RepID=UPI0036582E8A